MRSVRLEMEFVLLIAVDLNRTPHLPFAPRLNFGGSKEPPNSGKLGLARCAVAGHRSICSM
jgi:hypothetical protein